MKDQKREEIPLIRMINQKPPFIQVAVSLTVFASPEAKDIQITNTVTKPNIAYFEYEFTLEGQLSKPHRYQPYLFKRFCLIYRVYKMDDTFIDEAILKLRSYIHEELEPNYVTITVTFIRSDLWYPFRNMN